MKGFDVELVQFTPKVGDREANKMRMVEIAEESPAELVVFGELSTTGYSYSIDLRSLAGEIDNFKDLAKEEKRYIAYGAPILDGEKLYNTMVLETPDGEEIYRKVHLPHFGPFREKDLFSEGDEVKVVDTELGKMGLMICYDISFPELARVLMMRGAEIMVCISASPLQSRPFFEKVLPARAAENSSYLIYVNLCGEQNGLQFFGGSRVLDPWGEEIAKARYIGEDRVVAHLDGKVLEKAKGERPMEKDVKSWLLPL
jgi:predicted amidohydrolase